MSDGTTAGAPLDAEEVPLDWPGPRQPMLATRVETLRRIVEEHTADEIDGSIVDPTTANLLLKVHDALAKPENRAKFETIDLVQLVDFCWSRSSR